MKKLFNHTKKPVDDWKGYDENDYDWDISTSDSDCGEYDEEDDYYEDRSQDIAEEESAGTAEYY